MNKKQYRLPVMILSAFIFGLYVLLAARPVEANASPWVRWKISFTYPKNNLDAQLIIQRGHTTISGRHVIDDEEAFPLSCLSNGNPVITNGQAIFDGSSYYQCEVPSIREKALQLWQLSIPDDAVSRRPYITGQVTIEGNPIDSTPENPIFYREDIQFNTSLDVTAQKAAMTMAFGQASAESSTFTIDPAGHDLLAYFARSSPTTFSPYFVVDNNSLSATPAILTQSRIVSNLESTIYFGYSPLSGEYFEGSVGPLVVDPVCPTTG